MKKQKERKNPKNEKVEIAISVHQPGGRLFEGDVKVMLSKGKSTTQLRRKDDDNFYKGNILPGVYTLSVESGEMQSPEREIEVKDQVKNLPVYLGKKNWPFYRMGESIVPFEPKNDLVAFFFETNPPYGKSARAIDTKIKRRFKIKPYDLDNESKSNVAGDGSIWIYQLNDPKDLANIRKEAEEVIGRDVRIGTPVDMIPDQIKLIDNRFIVRFQNHLKPVQIQELLRSAKARSLRKFIQAGNGHLIEFREGTIKNHLKTIESWYVEGLLVYGEPDLIAEVQDDVFPADPPDDTLFGTQANLTLQNADDAWQFLNTQPGNITLGSPNVTVCTLDRGIDTDHPDIGGNLTDGQPQLSQCYDFSGMQPCTVAGYFPDTSHGMGVYGIIAALTDNNLAIAGIAPNTHQIGLERPLTIGTANYADVLLWAAGFTTGNTTAGWPAEPISPGADIISCSHGLNGAALSGLMDDTFEYLATYGRGGRGTLVIYSAGNNNTLITGFRTWAAHPRTMAIANSNQPNAAGVEVKNGTSNFGPEIDICAQGAGAPSLNRTGGTQTFGGTSAAAPTVAAAAALMLSVENGLTWINLRDILRNSAVVIDGANTNPVGQWILGFSQWYGFGRLDIDAAVQGADTFDTGSVNLVIRDNTSDMGMMVPTGGTFWRSPDIWIRNADPATEAIGDPAYGVNPPNQSAIAGADNWVRVRVKNVGTAASSNYFVRLYLTHFAGSQFVYPDDYIPTGNPGDPLPSPLVQGTYLIGEQFVNTLAASAEAIYNILWPAAMVPRCTCRDRCACSGSTTSPRGWWTGCSP